MMRKRRMNTLLVRDTLYELTEAYRNGARACRAETPFWANPHRDGSQRHADWAAGHDNEAAGLHRVSVTVDAIEARAAGLEFTVTGEGSAASPPEPPPPYRVFTTRYDEVVRAAELLSGMADRLPELRDRADWCDPSREGAWTGPDPDALSGALSGLERALKGAAPVRPVLFLLDNSGSMRRSKIEACVGALRLVGPVLEGGGVPFEVLGFTTRTWKGGRSREEWLSEGRPNDPGRLCDLRHVIYKRAEDPWDPDPMCLMFSDGFLKENVDGEALLWAENRARALGGGTILHLTDGTPMDQSTLASNPYDYLERHLEEVRRGINADPELQLLTLPVAPDPSRVTVMITRALLSVSERAPAPEPERDEEPEPEPERDPSGP